MSRRKQTKIVWLLFNSIQCTLLLKSRLFHAIANHSLVFVGHVFSPQKRHWLRKLNHGEVTSRLFENVDKICRNKYIIIILDGTRNYTGYMEDILVFLIFDKPL